MNELKILNHQIANTGNKESFEDFTKMTDKPATERKKIILEELVKLFSLTNFNGGFKLSVVNGKVIQAQKLESPFNDWD